ncbi:MAG: hypothetical protein LKF75_01645 [Bacilli bacterium]|nr:hypothetical protein [Bacilli bacterium]MCH4228396.1 hypothetical protein [Bacilli bacterium]MCH4277917.1 hypothetical protein [Bacilli bacterium]MCI2054895.1 hypothetical protein [Bacilli bacterium]
MRGRYKKWAAPFLNEHPEFVIETVNKEDGFFKANPLYLEIGAGKGDFVLGMALRGGNFLALERDVSVCGHLGKRIADEERNNIKISPKDFDDIYPSLKGLKFKTIFLNFSDPWPKKKHWKRRLTTKERLTKMASILEDGGEIRFKSDNLSLYEFTKEEAVKAKLNITLDEPNYVFDEKDDVMSEYERNFREQGLPIHRLFIKR